MRRRDFLKIISLPLAGYASLALFEVFKGSKKYLLQPYEDRKSGKFGILAFDFSTGEARHVYTHFNVHNIFFDEKAHEFIGVNKYGPRYLKFKDLAFNDLRYYQVDKNIFNLSGHVSSVSDDEYYYLTGIHSETQTSSIIKIHKVTGYSSLATKLERVDPPVHDCKFGYGSDYLIATSSNKIHAFDRKTKKLTSQKINLTSTRSSLRHFSINKNHEICLQSNLIDTTKGNYTYGQGEVVFLSNEQASSQLTGEINKSIEHNELLDFAFDKTDRLFACVHGGSPFLTIWMTSPFRHVKTLKFNESIVRVTPYFDEPRFLVMARERFYLVDIVNFSVTEMSSFKDQLKGHFSYGHKTLLTV